jgi:diadenosine tetraphosphate (Ap4A) HIT family hydrolase
MSEQAPAAEPHCHMCDRANGSDGIILRDDHFTAFGLADRPGWVLYATNRHSDWIWGLTDDEAAAYGPFLKRLSGALKEASGTSHIYYVGLGENSLHFHGILAARYEPFAKDIQSALAVRGGEIADAAAAGTIADKLQDLLVHDGTTTGKGTA